jgi:transketolase
LEVTSGSLGHGFSVGVGIALGARLKATDQKVYAVVGDGELNEGPIWEGVQFAAHWHLDNLIVLVDQNGFQAMGSTDEVIGLGSIAAKFESFGFDAVDVDGHNEFELEKTLSRLLGNGSRRPKAVIAKTVKGKGVSFMEHNNVWHYTRLSPDTYAQAIAELGSRGP